MAVAATFIAESLLAPLELALGELGLQASLQLAPYPQLLQQLTSPSSLLTAHMGVANVVLIRLEDFVREVVEPTDALSLIDRAARELPVALLQFTRRSRSPLLVMLLPVSTRRAEPLGEALHAATASLQALISSASLHSIDVAQIAGRCGSEGQDRLRDELAHIPYTEEYFAAMALELAAHIHALCLPRHVSPPSALTSGTALLRTLRGYRRGARPLRERVVQAASPLERELLTLWEELLNIEALGVEDNFFALGGTSLLAAELCAQLARRCGVRLRPAALIAAPTVRLLARALQSEQALCANQDCSALIELRPGGPLNLFLVHDDNGETRAYRALARRLPGMLSVYGIEPQHLPLEPLASCSVSQMARDYIAQIRGVQPQGPYRLGGLAAGAVIAYEMARQLRATGEDVALLALLDAARPGAGRRPVFVARQRILRLWVRVRFALLRRWLARVHPGPARLAAAALRGIYESAEQDYVPPPLAGAGVLLVRAHTKLGTSRDIPSRLIYLDKALGWGSVVTDLEILDTEGGHLSMLQEPQVIRLAALLAERLLPKVQHESEPAIASTGAH